MGRVIKDVLSQSVKYLKSNGVETCILDAQLLLSHILNKDKLYLTVHGDEKIDEDILQRYNKLLLMRAQGMPIQYIIGSQEFMSLPFKVTSDVLIPRADTEVLVEYIIQKHTSMDSLEPLAVMDIGTGSGCIAVSLAYYIKNINVWAVDISTEALNIAKENAESNAVKNKIKFIQYDILKGFPLLHNKMLMDVIVSNPPYIPTQTIHGLETQVKDYEPSRALDGGEDGLMFYRLLVKQAAQYLKSGGLLAFEVGHDQSSEVGQLIQDSENYECIEIMKDLAGINRVVGARKI